MAESSQPQNQPEVEEISGIAHVGFGDININLLSLGRAVKFLKRSGQNEEAVALERFILALKQLNEYQQMVSELSNFISMLLDLESALVTVQPTIRKIIGRSRVDFDDIERTWKGAIWLPIRKLSYFASDEAEFLKETHFEDSVRKFAVQSMIEELVALEQSFEDSLKEQNTQGMYVLSKSMYKLERVTNQLAALSNQVLTRIDNG